MSGGGCLSVDRKSCRLSLLSGNGDTLSNIIYFNTCENIDDYYKERENVSIFVYRHFFRVHWEGMRNNYYNYYPAPYAMFKYDERGNISSEPLFWYDGGGKLITLTGNTMEY